MRHRLRPRRVSEKVSTPRSKVQPAPATKKLWLPRAAQKWPTAVERAGAAPVEDRETHADAVRFWRENAGRSDEGAGARNNFQTDWPARERKSEAILETAIM